MTGGHVCFMRKITISGNTQDVDEQLHHKQLKGKFLNVFITLAVSYFSNLTLVDAV